MEQNDQAVFERFRKNPDETWTCVQPTALKVGNRIIAIAEGMTFTKGVPYLVVDVVEWLEEHSK